MIVVSWGGASAGKHLEVFLRTKGDGYQQQKVEISDLAWREMKRVRRLPRSSQPTHQYSALISTQNEPLSFIFMTDGDYAAPIRRPFDQIRLQYLVDSKSVRSK
jgi:hypothetical protein